MLEKTLFIPLLTKKNWLVLPGFRGFRLHLHFLNISQKILLAKIKIPKTQTKATD